MHIVALDKIRSENVQSLSAAGGQEDSSQHSSNVLYSGSAKLKGDILNYFNNLPPEEVVDTHDP